MSKKLGISLLWFFRTYPYNGSLIHISTIMEGVFEKYGILVSSIYVSEYCKSIMIHFQLFLTHRWQYRVLKNLLPILKALFVLKYNKNIHFDITLCKSILQDDKLISSFIKCKIRSNPSTIGFLTQKLFKKVSDDDKLEDVSKI